MKNSRGHIVVEASGTRLMVAILRQGRVVEHRAEWFAQGDWSSSWPAGLADRRDALARMTAELGVSGSEATIVYHAPSTIAGVFPCPSSAGSRGSKRAAALALAELSGFAANEHPSACQYLADDKATTTDDPAPLHRHTLAVTDRRSSTEAVAVWAAAAGLCPTAITPSVAPMLVAGVALTARSDATAKLGLWIGEHESVLAASVGGRLLFVRTLAVGTEAMVEALGRPIRIKGDDAREPLVLSGQQARQMLFRSGIPSPEDVLDARQGLLGSTVLPLLQPMLQRLAVEVKQSVRFGLPEKAREGAALVLAGPGALVPALGKAVSAACGLTLAPAIEQTIINGPVPIVLALPELMGCQISLLPASFEHQETVRHVRTGLRLGMAACLTMIGLSASLSWMSLRQARAALAGSSATDLAAAQGLELQERVAAARFAVERKIEADVGPLPALGGLLSLLAEAAPAGLELASIEIRQGDPLVAVDGAKPGGRGPTTMRLSGIVRDSAPQGLAKTLKTFTEALTAAPIVTSVRLGGTQRGEHNGVHVSRFEMVLSTLGLPPDVPLVTALKEIP